MSKYLLESAVSATYYFNASISGPTDAGGVWTNDANAFDGSTATFASALGDTNTSKLIAFGTTAPTSGGTITSVKARLYAYESGDGSGSASYSAYVTLTAPSGGWTWSAVNGLETRVSHSDGSPGLGSGQTQAITYSSGVALGTAFRDGTTLSNGQTGFLARIELLVTYTSATTDAYLEEDGTSYYLTEGLASDLTDNFDTNVLDTTKWLATSSAGTTVANASQEMEFTTSTTAGYATLDAKRGYFLPGSEFYVNLVNAGNQSLGSLEVELEIFRASIGSTNEIFWYINAGTIAVYKVVGGTQSLVLSGTYNSATHKWLKVRESSGTLFFDYSADGTTWSNFTSLTNPFTVTSMWPRLTVGTFSAEASSTVVKFDNFGVVPATSGVTLTATQPATARIAQNITRTQPATARIATNPTKTLGAIARVANTRTKTQPAISRISNTIAKTQPVNARIAIVGTKTQSAKANIIVNTTVAKTQGATARIATNRANTQAATARISQTYTKTQSSIARVANNRTLTQLATARIAKNVTKTQPAIARIANNLTKTQSATARIGQTGSKTQTAISRLSQNYTKTQSSIARVAKNLTKTQSATANIIVNTTVAKTQSAIARIATNRANTQSAVARISQTYTKTQGAIARVATNRTKTQSAVANITVNGTQMAKTQSAIARIATRRTNTQTAISRIAQNYTATQSARSRISQNYTKTQPATSRIATIRSKSQTATASITAILTRTKTQSATARIYQTAIVRKNTALRLVVPAPNALTVKQISSVITGKKPITTSLTVTTKAPTALVLTTPPATSLRLVAQTTALTLVLPATPTINGTVT